MEYLIQNKYACVVNSVDELINLIRMGDLINQ
jgi:hypothetical protein